MYVVIVGGGEVGSYLARILVDEGHDVAIVEIDEGRASRLDASIDALVVHGSGISRDALESAGIEDADLLLAVTAVDEVNLIASMTARKYGAPGMRTVARVRQSHEVVGDLSLNADDLGLDGLVSPEEVIAASTMDALRYPGRGDMRQLVAGELVLVGILMGAGSPLVDSTLADLKDDFPREFLVVAVQGEEGIRIPAGQDIVGVGERAFVLTVPDHLAELAILSGQPSQRVERVLVVGCGNTGLALARSLESEGFAPTIIEQDRGRAEFVAGLLPRSFVLHGAASDPEFLRDCIEEEGTDAVVVLLDDAEESLLIGIFARSIGTYKVIVRCDEPGYVHLADRLGLDAVLSPKRAMANGILRYVRRGLVEWTLLLGEHGAEVSLFRIPESPASPELVEEPLKALGFPQGALLAAVVRDDNVVIGSGDTVLQPGDEVVVVVRPEALDEVEELFS